MAKTVTGLNDSGRVVTHKPTRRQRRSTQRLIPWTPGPRTAWERFKRAAID